MPATPTIAVDVAKSVFEVAVSTRPGRVAARHRLTRAQFARFVATQPPATPLMEACGTAHYWGRHAQQHGHRVVLLPPQAVRPYVPRNKTDRADAKGLLEAARNESIHPVPVKSEAQQALTALLGLGPSLREQSLVRCVRPDPEPHHLFARADAERAIATSDSRREDRLGGMDRLEP